jgi:cystathionine beta-lyase
VGHGDTFPAAFAYLAKDTHVATVQTALDSLTEENLIGVVGAKWTYFPDCIGAFVAEMDYGTAPAVVETLRATVDAGFFGYLPRGKSQELGEAVSRWYREEANWEVPAEWISPLPDVLHGLSIASTYFTKPGAKIIVATPAYMPFLTMPSFLGREHVEVPMLLNDGQWEYDYAALDATFADGDLLIVCNPHNPIGRVLTTDEMVKISEIVDRHNGRVFSDEIHAPLRYPGHPHVPYASVNDVAAGHTITAIAASKAWNLAGLKCAQLVLGNEADVAKWKEVGTFAGHGASTVGVLASIAAYNDGREWLAEISEYLDGNRRYLADLIAQHLPGIVYHQPEGTYLAWLDFRNTGLDGDLADFFRERAKVALTDGSACGEVGQRHIRFNFAMPRPLLETAVTRMGEALASFY